MQHLTQMGEAPIGKLLLKFSIPSITMMLVNALYNVVDRIVVGQYLGTEALAAVTLAFPLMIVSLGIGLLAGAGASNIASLLLGEKQYEEAAQTIGSAAWLGLAFAVFLTVGTANNLDGVLKLCGATPSTLGPAKTFTSVILIGFIFQAVAMGVGMPIRAQGRVKTSMVIAVSGTVLNAILCVLFVGPLKMGIAGSAWATVIAQMFGLIISSTFYLTPLNHLKMSWKSLALKWDLVAKIFFNGLTPFALQLISIIIFILFNTNMTVLKGDTGIAAIGIVNTVMLLVMLPVLGLVQGAQPLIGYNLGAQNPHRVRQVIKMTAFWSTLVLTLWTLYMELFPESLIWIFNSRDQELLHLGALALRVFLIFLPGAGITFLLSQFYQSANKVLPSILTGLGRQFLLILLLIVLPKILGLWGVLLSGPFSDAPFVILSVFLLIHEMNRLKALPPRSEPLTSG